MTSDARSSDRGRALTVVSSQRLQDTIETPQSLFRHIDKTPGRERLAPTREQPVRLAISRLMQKEFGSAEANKLAATPSESGLENHVLMCCVVNALSRASLQPAVKLRPEV